MKDSWQAGDAYEYYMGRWSRLVARSFTDWLALPYELNWADIGCGSGALSEAIINKHNPAMLYAIDQSSGFIKTAQQRLGVRAICHVGNALSLPIEDSSVHTAVSGLVLNFIPERGRALAEMKRITSNGGYVAVYVWDYAGTMEFLNNFWDTAVELNPGAAHLHEGRRFPDTNATGLTALFKHTDLVNIETTPIEITINFRNFEDYWTPFLGGQGPAPGYVLSLNDYDRDNLKQALYEHLPIQSNGSISMAARAWAARGTVKK